MVKSLGDYLVLILSVFGSLASIIAFGIYFEPSLSDQGWVGVLFLGILSLFFLGYNYFLISKYRKKSRYAEVFDEINIAFAQMHNIDRNDNPSIELIVQKLSFFCDHIAIAFTRINGHNIGVCIKFLSSEGDRALVQTLVRDSKSISNDRKTGTKDKTKHYLDLNTDFEFIYSNFDNDNINTTYYYEPNIPTCKDYKNTRLKSNWLPKAKFYLVENWIRRQHWPLKYRSTLVVPIVPLIANEQEQKSIRGFLCIDSPKENSFFETFDVHILKGLSDGLYNKIDKLDNLIKVEQSDNKSKK
jgi:hypothetical protein